MMTHTTSYTEIGFSDRLQVCRFLQLAGARARAARQLGNTEAEDEHEGLRHSLAGILEVHDRTGRGTRPTGWLTDGELATLRQLGWKPAAGTPIPPRPS